MSYAFFRIQNAISPIRSRAEDELVGLDLPEMGVLAYPDYVLHDDAAAGSAPALRTTPAVSRATPTT